MNPPVPAKRGRPPMDPMARIMKHVDIIDEHWV
jgi:hypothetical protein